MEAHQVSGCYPCSYPDCGCAYSENDPRRAAKEPNMLNRDEEIERIIRLVHDMADDHVLRECVGKALNTAYSEGYKQQHELERLRGELAEWKQAASVEANLRREFSAEVERLKNGG